ncbi:40S ribosomal protein S30 [Phytophthora cinnamomi]|uniref:40S ribosomal protein S30 n=1 Tax=Phytophthora cinnamomi TaxID=4785 RepID=UPI00355A5308|nr:40S ribosomal protein S30 [Phytophthora cinnamomi]
MYSDDSAASEVESDVEETYGDGGSEVASEIAESVDVREPATALKQQLKQQTLAKPSVSDAYEEDEDGYSVDFEDDFEEDEEETPTPQLPPPAPIVKALSPTRSAISTTHRSAVQSDDASAHEYEYDEASFEEESRRSQSQRSLSPSNRVVNLSVRAASPSFRPTPAQESGNDLPGDNFVLPTEVLIPAPVPPRPTATALASVAEEEAEVIATMQSKHFSLLLRKVESKFEDEVEELREKNALLMWKERELKASLRRAKEELTMRKARIEKKRRRAADRRREHERAAERVQQELAAAHASISDRERRIEELQHEFALMREVLQNIEREKHEAEGRNLVLAEKLQAALGDFHQLTCSFEDAVNAKLACEQRIEELKGLHRVQLEVLEHKCQVDVEAARRALKDEVAARTAERKTLPEIHQRIVEAEKERFEKLEAALHKQMRELESRAAQEALTHAAELTRATEAKHQAEQRAERRIQDEVDRIAREREAVDEQRRELLASVARTNARFDEERGKMEASSCELDARRSELADERAELGARIGYIEQRTRRLEEDEALVERRRTELAAIGRETLERSHALARRAQEFADATAEREKLRTLVKVLTERSERSEQRVVMLEQDREKLEAATQALQQERLLVAKQRMQSRYFLDGARKLESMLHQKHCVLEAADKRQPQPKAALYANNQLEHRQSAR